MIVDWKKPVIVTGDAGCGKSHTIHLIVTHLVNKEYNVLVAAPTGFLAAVFKAILPVEVQCYTVHASFHYPVDNDVSPSINWHLSDFDVIIIDEISMIPEIIFQRMLRAFNVLLFCPVILLSGDAGQQQPFLCENGKIMQLTSPFDNFSFLNSCYNYRLRQQHHVAHNSYLEFLICIRKWVPTQQYLDQIQEGRVICAHEFVTDDAIIDAYCVHPNTTILTFTKQAANRTHKIIIDNVFMKNMHLLCYNWIVIFSPSIFTLECELLSHKIETEFVEL